MTGSDLELFVRIGKLQDEVLALQAELESRIEDRNRLRDWVKELDLQNARLLALRERITHDNKILLDERAVLRAEAEHLRAVIERALAELMLPVFYGPGSVWEAMIEATG